MVTDGPLCRLRFSILGGRRCGVGIRGEGKTASKNISTVHWPATVSISLSGPRWDEKSK